MARSLSKRVTHVLWSNRAKGPLHERRGRDTMRGLWTSPSNTPSSSSLTCLGVSQWSGSLLSSAWSFNVRALARWQRPSVANP